MDNNNIGGMNPQQFSQNTPQTSQPHMGMSGIELQKMQQEADGVSKAGEMRISLADYVYLR